MSLLRHPTILVATCALACGAGSKNQDARPTVAGSAGKANGGSGGSSGGAGGSSAGGSSGTATGGNSSVGGAGGSSGSSGRGTGGAGGSPGGSAGKSAMAGTGGSGQAGGPPDPPKPECGDDPNGTPPVLKDGEWVNISPPGLFRPNGEVPPYGCMDIKVSPCNPWTLYLTTDSEGMWRSTDGGGSWSEIGMLPAPTSPGVLEINPENANMMYYVGGVRGATVGFWVSSDGGDTWAQPQGFTARADNSEGGWTSDVYDVKADPKDFKHVLLTFHSPWEFKADAGVLESKDGGNTWTRHGPGNWGTGHSIWFLNDSNTWLLGTQSHGYFRTTDGGANWTQVSTQDMMHGGTGAYYSKDGVLYVGALSHILRSTDNGETFDLVAPNTQDGYYAIVGDGNFMYTARANTGDSTGAEDTYLVSDESDGTNWTAYNGQMFRNGPYRMAFEPKNKIIYSANWNSGVWALKVVAP